MNVLTCMRNLSRSRTQISRSIYACKHGTHNNLNIFHGQIYFQRCASLTYGRPVLTMDIKLNSNVIPGEYKSKAEELYLSNKENEKTFQYQDELPSLPVPPLQQTLDKYLDSVVPHLTPEEFKETEALVQQFGSGIGKDLHQKLLEKAKTERNWLEKWWLKVAYLDFRLPTAPYVNFAGPGPFHHHYWPPEDGTQLGRTAILTHHVLKYWQILRKEQCPPHKKDKKPFCMDQFKRLFSTNKEPGITTDQLRCYFKTEREGPCPTNLVVLKKGHIFTFNAVDDCGEPLTGPEIQLQLQRVSNLCDRLPHGAGVAACTGHDRTSWSKLRDHLLQLHPDNQRHLQIIQEAIFTICLEDYDALGDNQVMERSLSGEATNRWLDKSLTLVSYRNGTFATNSDHTPFDGMVLVHLMIYCDLKVFHEKGVWTGTREVSPLPEPKRLDFHLDSVIYDGIQSARKMLKTHAGNVESYVPVFTEFGKDELKRLKIHPDTFVQLAIQYAYYRMTGKPGCCYETATTRKFYHARTETVRSCTPEAIEWSMSMLDPAMTSDKRFELLKKAEKKHNTLMSECQDGQGCDRHLLGLRLIAAENHLSDPEIFKDKAWVKSGGDGNFIISTSLSGYSSIVGGISPMCKNGYGTFYRIPPTHISMVLTRFKSDEETDVRRFYENIVQSLREMRQLLEENQCKPDNVPNPTAKL